MSFTGKIALITGASSGIGRATSLALAREGACLALAARSAAALESLADEARRLGVEALPIPTDVSHPAEVAALGAAVLQRFGRVDILVSSAGQYVRSPLTHPDPALLDRAMAVNFYGNVNTVNAVLPAMLEQRSGHIVLVSSMDGRRGLPAEGPYVASKAALSAYGDVLRQELHGSGVGLTVVSPGRVDTPLIDHLRVPWISAKIPPEPVARAILRAIRRRQPEVILPPQAWLLYFFSVLSPGFTDWAVRLLHLEGWES
jgi:NADP-dependent 3-hydroxy acid dehydrogenase YdfG